jgi:adenosylmethionine-8-amino-7-oxononanoate aminotransferase
VAAIRQRGLMVGVELQADPATATPYPYAAAVGARVCSAVRRHGVILRPLGSVIVLMPPLCVGPAELDLLVTATAAAITEVTAP